MYMFPLVSKRNSCGVLSCAAVAGPPSPEYPFVPVPASTEIFLLRKSSRRRRWLPYSTQYSAPSGPMTRPKGLLRVEWPARSPLAANPSTPVPANVAIRLGDAGGGKKGAAIDAAANSMNSRRVCWVFIAAYFIRHKDAQKPQKNARSVELNITGKDKPQ